MLRIIQSEKLCVTGALLKENVVKENWTALSKQDLADKACRKGREVGAVVVRTLLERVIVSWAEMAPMH